MALVDITNKIAAEARVRVAEIERETATKVAQIAEEYAEKLANDKRKCISELDATIAAAQKVALSRARRDARGIADKARRTMIDKALTESRSQIAQMDEASYRQWIGALVDTVPESEFAQITQVFAPSARLEVTKEVCAQHKLTAPVVADDSIDAGLRLESEQVAYDLTVARLLGDQRSELEPVIADKLFS